MSTLAQAEKQVDNPYISSEMNSAYDEFLRTHPDFAKTAMLDEWRKRNTDVWMKTGKFTSITPVEDFMG